MRVSVDVPLIVCLTGFVFLSGLYNGLCMRTGDTTELTYIRLFCTLQHLHYIFRDGTDCVCL